MSFKKDLKVITSIPGYMWALFFFMFFVVGLLFSQLECNEPTVNTIEIENN